MKFNLFFNLLLLVCGVFALQPALAQDKHTISGYIASSANGEALNSAKIYVPSLNKGAITNNYGFYSLTLPSGIYEIEFRFTGLTPLKKTVDLTLKNVSLNVELGLKDGEKVYDATGLTFEKQRSDLFRHGILGLWFLNIGTGDLIIKTSGAQNHTFDLPNVISIESKIKAIEL